MFTLPTLNFAIDALEPYIGAQTVDIHYNKHHQTYITNLNNLVAANPSLEGKSLEELLTSLDTIDPSISTAVLNNAGQVYNHNLYWESIGNNLGSNPEGQLLEQISLDFGSLAQFKEEFEKAGITQFGSGWAWLSLDTNGKLVIDKTSNAQSPLIQGKTPLLTMDVWEHAYYLNYQNRRADYIKDFWSIINWRAVEQKYIATKS